MLKCIHSSSVCTAIHLPTSKWLRVAYGTKSYPAFSIIPKKFSYQIWCQKSTSEHAVFPLPSCQAWKRYLEHTQKMALQNQTVRSTKMKRTKVATSTYAERRTLREQNRLRSERMSHALKNNGCRNFWSEIRKINRKSTSVPPSDDGTKYW